MKRPATNWQERISDDETERFARQGERIRALQTAKNTRWGAGRFLHRKELLAVKATFEVESDLPEAARHGVFARAGRYEALVRLSHGSFDLQANTKPDIRGFAVKVLGVEGPGALGGRATQQDFLLINHDAFASRSSEEFLEVTLTAAAKGELGLVWHLVRRYGVGAGLKRLKLLTSTLGKPFAGYNAEAFSTAVPLAFGPYAGKLRLTPLAPQRSTQADPGEDLKVQLAKGPLAYQVAVQFFTDEATTPIEDPPARWPEAESPFVPVATLTLSAQPAEVEALRFDPWGGLEAHRPLGEIMRSRKGAYYVSQKGRTAN